MMQRHHAPMAGLMQARTPADDASWDEMSEWGNSDPLGYMGYLREHAKQRSQQEASVAQQRPDPTGFEALHVSQALANSINATGPNSMAPMFEALKLQEEKTGRRNVLVGGRPEAGSNQLTGQSSQPFYMSGLAHGYVPGGERSVQQAAQQYAQGGAAPSWYGMQNPQEQSMFGGYVHKALKGLQGQH